MSLNAVLHASESVCIVHSMGIFGGVIILLTWAAISAPMTDAGATKQGLQMVLEVQHTVDAGIFQSRGYIPLSTSDEEQNAKARLEASRTIPFSDSIQTNMEKAIRVCGS